MPVSRLALAVVTSALLAFPVACSDGGSDGDLPDEDGFAVERQGMSLTLTSDACTYEGLDSTWAGPVAFEIVNSNDEEGSFEVVKLADDASFDDLDEYITRENDRLARGRDVLGEPRFVSVVSSLEVPAANSVAMNTELGAGRYAVLCITGYPLKAIYATAPLEVTGSSLILTDDSCEYEGPRSPSSGTLSIAVANEGDADGGFELVRIEEGSTFDDLVSHVEEERRRIEQGRKPEGPPPYVTVAGRAEVAAGNDGLLTATVSPGTYALQCFVGPPPTAIYAAAPLDVTS